MERLRNQKNTGLSSNALRTCGLLFLAAGAVGRGIIQNQLLGIGAVSTQQLLEAMQNSDSTMMLATLSLVLQAIETCAVPVFVLLLVEGFQHTSNFKHYLLRVAGVAVLSEIPYNLTIGGSFLDFQSRNPVFGMVVGLILLFFYQYYAGKTVKNVLIKILVTVCAVLWTMMLNIEFGECLVLVVCVLWIFRSKSLYRNFIGATVTILCTVISPFYLAAPMGFLIVHMHNGEQGEDNRLRNYLSYPVIMLLIGLIAMFAF